MFKAVAAFAFVLAAAAAGAPAARAADKPTFVFTAIPDQDATRLTERAGYFVWPVEWRHGPQQRRARELFDVEDRRHTRTWRYGQQRSCPRPVEPLRLVPRGRGRRVRRAAGTRRTGTSRP